MSCRASPCRNVVFSIHTRNCGTTVARQYPLLFRPAARRGRQYYHELSYQKPGIPHNVLQYNRHHSESPHGDTYVPHQERQWVRVEFLYSPLNPADLNSIEGVYPTIPTNNNATISNRSLASNRTVGGSEGIGRVTHILHPTTNDNRLKVGDIVIPSYPGMGTFRSSVCGPSSAFTKFPLIDNLLSKNISLASIATLSQIGGTAHGLLSFNNVQEGDVVLQNGGASAVGVMTSQLAASPLFYGKVASIVRRGDRTSQQFDELKTYLHTVGKCVLVAQEEELINDRSAVSDFKAELRTLSVDGDTLPTLGLNCVGGKCARVVAQCLNDDGGTMVTYGNMSKQPISLSASFFIFKNLTCTGYWHSRWVAQHSKEEEKRIWMLEQIANAVLQEQITCSNVRVFPLKECSEAIQWHDHGQDGATMKKKIVFDCREEE